MQKIKKFLTDPTIVFKMKIPRFVIAILIWFGYSNKDTTTAIVLTLVIMGVWFFWVERGSKWKKNKK